MNYTENPMFTLPGGLVLEDDDDTQEFFHREAQGKKNHGGD